jgi:sec-independent protein translocase protein TatC
MSQNNFNEAGEQSFISHLIELRNRLLRAVLCVLVVFLGLASYANEIYSLLAGPLLKHMPKNSTMIAIDVASPFFTPFKLALIAAIFISVPYILYQFWAFVAPGLYKREKRMILPLLVASTLLFYLGIAFAYFVVFPLVFGFLTAAAPEGVAVMTDIAKYLDFVLAMFFAFGVCFEVPIFTIVLVWTGVISPEGLAEKRPYVIVGAFIVGAVLTPPDALSQTLLAVPMWMLFELGLLCSRLFAPKPDSDYQAPSDREMEARLDRIEHQEDD